MIVSPHPQRSPEWHQERLALPTASEFNKIITTKGKPSESAKKYLYELVGEYKTGRAAERFVSWKMQKAAEREPEAREMYELVTGYEVKEVGLCYKDEQKRFGASPDGHVDPDGGFETKDAEPHIQVMRFLEGWSGMDHWIQCQGGMMVCDRKWWDLQSYCEGMEPIIIRFWRNEGFIKKLEAELIKFSDRLFSLIRRIKEV